jgi:hypothetical protein
MDYFMPCFRKKAWYDDTNALFNDCFFKMPSVKRFAYLFLSFFLLCWASASVYADETVDILQSNVELSERGYKLATRFSFELSQGLTDALHRGVPLFFVTEVELSRSRWYWFDDTSVSASRTLGISYNVLTRRYQVMANESLQQTYTNLDDALWAIKLPPRWLIAERGGLKSGVHRVSVRMYLDVSQLSKPFQVTALNNTDWRLSSDWKRFNYKVE